MDVWRQSHKDSPNEIEDSTSKAVCPTALDGCQNRRFIVKKLYL